MNTGSAPATASAWIRARGVNPWRCTAVSDAISTAAEPSEIWEAVAAVSSQPWRSGLSSAIFASVVSRRGPSSVVTPPTGVISRSNRPSSIALIARAWLSSANSSSWERLMPHFSHISCAPRNWEISWFAVTVAPALPERQRHAPGQRDSRAHRHHAHALDAGRDDQVLRAGQHALGGEVNCLLRGAALPVDRDARHALRQARRQPRVPGDVDGLRADLRDAAHDDVLDRAPDRLRSWRSAPAARAPRGPPGGPSTGRRSACRWAPYRPDDVCLGHHVRPS